jgi:hypothetical protein
MSSRIHPQARTTPKIRQKIKDSGLSSRETAKVFNITRATAHDTLGLAPLTQSLRDRYNVSPWLKQK